MYDISSQRVKYLLHRLYTKHTATPLRNAVHVARMTAHILSSPLTHRRSEYLRPVSLNVAVLLLVADA